MFLIAERSSRISWRSLWLLRFMLRIFCVSPSSSVSDETESCELASDELDDDDDGESPPLLLRPFVLRFPFFVSRSLFGPLFALHRPPLLSSNRSSSSLSRSRRGGRSSFSSSSSSSFGFFFSFFGGRINFDTPVPVSFRASNDMYH